MHSVGQPNAKKNLKNQVVDLTETVCRQLEDRAISAEVCVKFGVGCIKRTGGSELLALPYFINGKASCYKIRPVNSKDPCFWHGDNDERGQHFFNVDCLSDPSLTDYPLIITEGELDALTIIPHFPKTVSVPNGATLKSIPLDDERNNTAFEYLNNAIEKLKDIKEIIIATDGDRAGRTLAKDLALRLGKPRCKWVEYPLKRSSSEKLLEDGSDDQSERCKDINESVKEYGENAVQTIIKKARWWAVSGVYTLDQLPPLPEPEVFKTGMGNLDKHLGIRLGDFSVFTGIPSHGKSTFVNDAVCRLSIRYNLKIAFASFEQPPQIDHKRNLERWLSTFPGNLPQNQHLTGQTQGTAASAAASRDDRVQDFIKSRFVFIVKEDDETADLDWLLEKMSVCVIQHDADIIVIDPYNEIDHSRDFRQSSTDYIGDSIKKLKRFASKYDVHVMVVAHPTKLSEKADGTLPIPNMYNIEDSRHWYNKCDVGVVVHRLADSTLIRVLKSRYHEILGTTGQVKFRFDPMDGRYHEEEF
jgi:twinkle protein